MFGGDRVEANKFIAKYEKEQKQKAEKAAAEAKLLKVAQDEALAKAYQAKLDEPKVVVDEYQMAPTQVVVHTQEEEEEKKDVVVAPTQKVETPQHTPPGTPQQSPKGKAELLDTPISLFALFNQEGLEETQVVEETQQPLFAENSPKADLAQKEDEHIEQALEETALPVQVKLNWGQVIVGKKAVPIENPMGCTNVNCGWYCDKLTWRNHKRPGEKGRYKCHGCPTGYTMELLADLSLTTPEEWFKTHPKAAQLYPQVPPQEE